MHCIEIKATDYNNFKAQVVKLGGSVSIVSRYTERSVRLLDVEVNKDTQAVLRLEEAFEYRG